MVSDELTHLSKGSSSNCLIMVPEFPQSPFFKQPINIKPHLQLLKTTASQVVSQLHSSISSTADKYFALLHMLASKSPLLCKLLSFSSHLQSLSSQIHYSDHNANLGSKASLNFAAILPGDSVAGVVVTNGILNFLNIYNTVLVLRLVLTWFPNAPPAIVSPLSTLCDPYLNIFRGFIPPLGGLDLSPILAFLVLNAFTSTASALPAELPSTGGASPNPSRSGSGAPFTASQRKWLKRITAVNNNNNSKTNSPGS